MKKVMLLFSVVIFAAVLSGCTSDNTNTDNVSDDSLGCSCSSNIYNCGDFSSHREAQECYESCGGVDNDIHELDRDLDGSACETL